MAALVLVACCWLAFGGALRCGFVNFDDDQYVFENAAVADGWTWGGVKWAFTTGHAANWHPLTWLSHMTDIEFFGLDPAAHHAVNVWLHALNAVLLFWVLRRWTGRFWPAWWVAALWCVHPLRVESVAWVSERKDVLSTLFALLALGAYGRKTPGAEARPTMGTMGWVALFFALSLMAKPTWVTLPFVLLLLDLWPLKRWKQDAARGLIMEKWLLFLLAVASCTVTFIVQQRGGAVGSLDLLPVGTRATNAIVAYAEYVRLLVWPSGLAVLYPYPEAGYSGIRVAGSLALVLGLSLAAVGTIRRWPWVGVGWLWFVGTLVPMIGLVQVGRQSWADRYSYVPHMGLILALVWGIVEALERWGWAPRRNILNNRSVPPAARSSHLKAVFATLALALVVGAALLSRRQTAVWQSNERLFGHAIIVTENNRLAHGNLGVYYGKQGRYDLAEVHLNEVLRLRSEDGGARYALGNVYQFQGRKEAALAQYLLAAQDSKQWEAMNNVAWLLATAPDGGERATEALQWAARAMQAVPPAQTATMWNTLSVARANAGDFEGAIEAAGRALEAAETSGEFSQAKKVRARIVLFQKRQPYRE